nr:glutaminyl-peptide cyclotransferase [Corynebacterium lubricantis]
MGRILKNSRRSLRSQTRAFGIVAAITVTSLALGGCAVSQSAPSSSDATEAIGSSTSDNAPVEELIPRIHEVYPFDQTSFTQGLELAPDGTLLVGTGQEGESRIYRRTIEGEELQSEDLDPAYFGEGITVAGDHIWQLTWKDGIAIERDAVTLKEVGTAEYEGEGWGLCAFRDHIVFSDGTSQLRRMTMDTLEEYDRFDVTLEGQPVEGINELECVGDDVYANVFTTSDIYRIDGETGVVTAVIDASGLPNNAESDPDNVLNGIAYDSKKERFLLSGKRWPDLYEVTFEPAANAR